MRPRNSRHEVVNNNFKFIYFRILMEEWRNNFLTIKTTNNRVQTKICINLNKKTKKYILMILNNKKKEEAR